MWTWAPRRWRCARRCRSTLRRCRGLPSPRAAPPTTRAWSPKYWFERYARLPVDVDVASEFRYREPPVEKGGAALFISQSGETADTLAALRYCAEAGPARDVIAQRRPRSTIGRESQVVFPTLCGPEIGVASTKALHRAAHRARQPRDRRGRRRAASSRRRQEAELVRELIAVAVGGLDGARRRGQIEEIAKGLSKAKDVLYLGRGQMFPIAMEGALKLKEISYIHAEGYAGGRAQARPDRSGRRADAGDRRGPIRRPDGKDPSNMQEVAARGGKIILVTDEEGARIVGHGVAEHHRASRRCPSFVAPILALIPVQLLAYHTAVFMGTDVDQPRNLAKSVTVE